ncbi:hypothetical protein [Haloarchaeobius sp. HRN-SO-5]|uniref:hypothetical protein n=1 Tax=Haloarchaeobius sp. HRN-SO-5 TaxID=3446118 RepID=UPI003EB78FF7
MVSNVAVSAVVLTVLVSGCLAGMVPTLGSAPPEPLPERPDTLTEQTVSNYTTTYEAAKTYNRHLDANPTENQITCRSNTRVALESAFVVRVQCMGGVPLANGQHIDVAVSTHYYVSDNTTIRIDGDDFRSVRHRSYRPNLTSFDVVNLANESTPVHVELERNGSESPLRLDYTIDPHSGVAQIGLQFEYGTTREMHVRTDDATTTAQFTSERIDFASPTVVYILPDGQVRITVGPSEP